MRNRNRKGQSMVEYALGLGCVAAVCMAALATLGHIAGDIIHGVQSAINYKGGPGPHDVVNPGRMVNASQTPWVID